MNGYECVSSFMSLDYEMRYIAFRVWNIVNKIGLVRIKFVKSMKFEL